LRRQYPEDRLTVVQADALDFDFSTLGDRLRIVGNLPYNISSPLLFHLIACVDHVVDQHFMLQREVIDRMAARPGTSDYGRLSVMLQWRYRITKLFDVPPQAFDPPPKVVSAVVRMVPLPDTRLQAKSAIAFGQVVAKAFSQRRKMLRRGLGDWAALVDWDALGIPNTARAEELSVEQFIALADCLLAAGVVGGGQPKNQ
jgi:16S rRNA (adenine1518-N6/adenine1519-N6)-dimethyltransferase